MLLSVLSSIQSFRNIRYAEARSSIFIAGRRIYNLMFTTKKTLPWGEEPRFELGLALQPYSMPAHYGTIWAKLQPVSLLHLLIIKDLKLESAVCIIIIKGIPSRWISCRNVGTGAGTSPCVCPHSTSTNNPVNQPGYKPTTESYE